MTHILAWFLVGGEDGTTSGVHSLDDKVVQYHLLLSPFNDVLLNTVLGHQTIYVHL